MDVGEGMVAMVRGVRDASLAVTLLDGTRKYTLMPNNAQFSNPMHVHVVRKQQQTQECARSAPKCEPTRCEVPTRCESTARCESATQANDGRYVSMYKTAHCHVTPTSPAVDLTEFPPQRADISPGHDNFEVGGTGSGDTYSPTRNSTSFRGGMSWTDRGSVYDPRPSHRPDAFANSLRKYPNASPERSTEMFERLINYSLVKDAKNNTRSQTSPSRISEANSNRVQKAREHETTNRTKKEESPTRESRSKKCDYECTDFRRAVFRNYDVRFLREVPNRTRDSVRNLPMQNTNSVNMEIQAVAEMTSREVATVPRADPSKRNLSPYLRLRPPSNGKMKVKIEPRPVIRQICTKPLKQPLIEKKISLGQLKSVQTSSSSIQLSNPDCACRYSYQDYRKSKSEEELRNRGVVEESAQFKRILNLYPSPKKMFCETKKVIKNSDTFKCSNNFENVPVSGTKSVYCKHPNLLNTTGNNPAKNPVSNIKDNLEITINEWIKDIPIKNKDFIGRHVNRQQATRIISKKLNEIICNAEDENALESGIVKLVEEIPFDVNDLNKNKVYISTLKEKFLQKSLEIFEFNAYNHWKKRRDCNNNQYESSRNVCPYIFKNGIKTTEEEVRGFVSEILLEFFDKSKSRTCSKRLQDVEIELTDVLIDSITELYTGNHIIIKKELFFILHDIGLISEYQAILLTDILLERFKSFINVNVYGIKKYRHSQTFVVLQNTSQSSPRPATNSTNISIESISQRDIDACLDFYINRLIQEINSWMSNALGPEISFVREVAVNDLAGDIVDRLKYLDKNPAKQGSVKDELEVMRFQIYKWINRLVGDDAVQQALDRAPELMERIQTIPVPMLSRPGQHGNTLEDSLPPCCLNQSSLKNNEFRSGPWFKKENTRQTPTNYNLPEMAMVKAPDQSGSGARKPALENRYNVPRANTSEAIMVRDAGNLNLSQMPMFGPAGGGGSMIETPGRRISPNKRFSIPDAFKNGPINQEIGINQMPMINSTGQLSNVIQDSNNQNLTSSRPPSPWSLASAPMFQNSENVNISRTPMYASSGQGINMSEVRETMSPSIRAAEEEVMSEIRKYNINEMPIFGVAGKGGSMIGAGSSNHGVRRISGPGAFDLESRARGPYQPEQRSPGSPAPRYVSSGPGLNMSEVRRPKTPGFLTAEELVPKLSNYNINEMPMFGVAGKGGSMIDAGSSNNGVRRMSGPEAFNLETQTRGQYQPALRSPQRPVEGPDPKQGILPSQLDHINQSVDQIQRQYDQFLINWIKELPLPTTTPEEKDVANLIRSGFYNGVWKTVIKVNLNPTKYKDRVYCQGVLDEEIQELFDALPEMQEIERRKDALKTNLIQKTIETISLIVGKSRASNYKQQLLEQVSNHFPNRVKISLDFKTDRHEDLQKIQLVDAFILYTRYKEDDKVKANVYRKKLNDRVEDIFKNIKQTNKAPLINIDEEVYKNEVINALHKVPLPTADVIKEEADEILLGIEIEKWFSDLPIVANNDPAEQLDRRRILNAFAKQIHDMRKQMNLLNDSSVEELKTATKRFLQKLPFQPNQEANLNFMAEEFANRLKNRARENTAQRPRSVSFEVPALFSDFSKNVPLSSSVAEVNSSVVRGNDRSQHYESNQDQSGRSIHILGNYEPSEPQQWLTLSRVSTAENERLLANFNEQLRQDAQESRYLSQHPQRAGGTIINPQQAGRTIISPQQARGTIINSPQAGGTIFSSQHAGGTIINPQKRGETIINPQQQIISERLTRASASALYTEAPQVMHTSFHGSIPFVQPGTTNEARIVAESQAVMFSGLPTQQKSNRTILNVPEIRTSHSKIEFGDQQVARTSIGSLHHPVPSKPIGILGTSQIAGSSGRQPMLKASNVPTIMPNIIVNEPNSRSHEVPQVSLSTHTAVPHLARPDQVLASNIPTERGLQNLSAPHQENPVPHTGNFYMSNQLPVAYSTPQQCHPPRGAPPKLEKKRPREIDRRRDGARRRLVFEDSDESDSEAILRTKTQSSFADPRKYRNEDSEAFCNSEKDLKNFRAVQTSYSTLHFDGSRDYRNDLRRSKSHEDNRKDSKKALIQDDVLQWWELYRDKEKMTKWEERLQRLAEKLKKPDGEEKLRLKIENYLRKVPSYFSDCDEVSKGFRETLPNIIIKKIKKYYLGNDKEYQSNFEVLRVEVPKYENSRNASYYKAIIKRWLKKLTIDRTVVKDDIVEFIVHKIEPLILGKPDFDAEFRYILKSNLIDIFSEIPIVIDSKDNKSVKKDFLNRITDDLIEDLLKNDIKITTKNRVKNAGVTCKIDVQSLRSTENDINEFIIDHLTHFLKISQVSISAQRKLYLERILVNSFMNAINSVTLDINKEDIILILHCVGELSEHQAKYFTNKLIDDLNSSFWKIHNKHGREDELPKLLKNSSYSISSHIFDTINKEPKELSKSKMSYNNVNLSHRNKKLEDEVEKWLQMKTIFLFEDAEFKRTLVKDLVENMSRSNTLVQSSLESLEYEVMKWFREFVGDNIIQHINIKDLVEKLMCVTESVIKPFPGQSGFSVVCQNVEVIPGPSRYQNLSYVEELIQIIFEWYHELPYDLVGSLDASLENHVIKELAESIYTKILSNENPNDVIENEVDTWHKNFLQTNPGVNLDKALLISKIKNVTFRKKLIDKDLLHKDVLQKYEDSIGNWFDKLNNDPAREDIFLKSKNMLVKELAARLYEIKKTQAELSNADIIKKMRREVSEWLIKVPIHPKHNISRKRDVMAKMLTDMIKKYSLPFDEKEKTISTTDESLKECDVIDWLKAQSFYTKNNANDKLKQERYITELANEIKNGQSLNTDKLVKYVKKLDLKQEYDDEFIQQTVANLIIFLRNVVNEVSGEDEEKKLIEIVKQWLLSLPLNITSEREHNMVECFMKGLLDILQNSKLKDSSSENQLLEAIKKIIKLLPVECKMKCDEKFLDHYSKSLLQQLNRIGKTGFKIDENTEKKKNEVKSPLRNPGDKKDLNVNNYMRQLTEQIEEWLSNLQLPEFKEKGLRAVVINELAKDIIDREKYLEINPSSRGTNIEEIDHLKFQIFKWINKLVGEENLKSVEHAPELMQRIQYIRDSKRKTVGNIRQSLGAGPSTYRISRPTNFEVGQMPILSAPGLGGSLTEGLEERLYDKRFSNPLGYPVDYIPKTYVMNGMNAPDHNNQNYANLPNMKQQAERNNVNSNTPSVHLQPESAKSYQSEVSDVAEGTTVAQIYQEYDEKFRQRSDEIPLEVSTPEEQTVANYIRQGIINIIWNTYFKLKSNPDIESDYKYVEIFMEDALDEIFNDLPATAAIQSIKHLWKINVIQDVITMLKKVHFITDSPMFKVLLHKHRHRLIAKAVQKRTAKGVLNYYVVSTADIFLSQKIYNEEDPIKANIYKLRLMKYIEGVVRRVEFYGLPGDLLNKITTKLLSLLNNVPVPGTDILPSEVNEVEIGYVIENWFNELPGIIPPETGFEKVWSRLRQLLARKINELESRIYADEFELDRLIMHEASLYLETPDMLCVDNVSNICEMVEDLAYRLRQRRQDQVIPKYTIFEQSRPLCSSIIQVNPNAIQVPTNSAPIEQCPANQPLMAENVVQPPHMSQAGLINLPSPTPQVLLSNVGQVVQPEVIASVHEQMEANIVNNTPQLVQQIEGAATNRITTAVAGYISHAGGLGSPRQVLETSNLVNIQNPVQGTENQILQQSHQSSRPQILSEPPTTAIPVNQIQAQIPQTQLDIGQAARSSQELLPNSRPTSTYRTRSTVRVGGDRNDLIEERVGKRVRCTCGGRCRCSRQRYICSCDDDDEEVLFVPCKYYF